MYSLLRGWQSEIKGSSLIRAGSSRGSGGVDLPMLLPGVGVGGNLLSFPWLVDALLQSLL